MEQVKLLNEADEKCTSVEKEDVEHAKAEKMELARKSKLDLTSDCSTSAWLLF